MLSEKQAGKRPANEGGMSDSIWSQPAPSSRWAPLPIDTATATAYNAYLNGTPTSADSYTTRIIPANHDHTPVSDVPFLTANEMRVLDNDAVARRKIREVAERNMSEAAARVTYPQLYIDAPPPTKVWPWGGVAGSEAVKQLQTKILASLAGGNYAASTPQTTSSAPSSSGDGARAAAAAAPDNGTTPMDITPAPASTTPRASAYPQHSQPSPVQHGSAEPKKADSAYVNKVAYSVDEVFPGMPTINSPADVAVGMRQVAALLYRDSHLLGASRVRGQMIINATPVAEQVNATLKEAIDSEYPNPGQVIQRTLTLEALAAKLEELAAQKDIDKPQLTPNLTAIKEVMSGLLSAFPDLVANINEMVAGMREVAAMLKRDADALESTGQVFDHANVTMAGVKEIHPIVSTAFVMGNDEIAQKVCDLRGMANALIDQADKFGLN